MPRFRSSRTPATLIRGARVAAAGRPEAYPSGLDSDRDFGLDSGVGASRSHHLNRTPHCAPAWARMTEEQA